MSETDPLYFHFGEAHNFDRAYIDVMQAPRTTEFKPIADSFLRNLDTVDSLAVLPVHLVFWSPILHDAERKARERLGLDPAAEGVMRHPKLTLARKEAVAEILSWHDPDPKVAGQQQWITGNYNLRFMTQGNPVLEPGLDAILAAMVTTAWMAFESMAVDLWIEAVNLCPAPLADRVIDGLGGRSLRMKTLKDYKYDMSREMGTFLRQIKAVNLDTLNNIKSAYGSAFDERRPLTANIFTKHSNLFAVSELRNCFAHRGGKIDSKSLAVTAIPGLEEVAENDIVNLTGPIVRTCISEITKCAADLFGFVDGWMHENAAKYQEHFG